MIVCPSCQSQFTIIPGLIGKNIKYCPCCKSLLPDVELSQSNTLSIMEDSSIVEGYEPEQIQFAIGPYQVLSSIGKGGMGEVFLAFDPTCGRKIALKRIRPDLMSHIHLHQRFLREARITSQLTHPSIIPIYSIQSQEGSIYYTMPYVEGKTLRQILAEARELERKGKKGNYNSSIPSLIRIFHSVCQAIAYAHSKHVIHRDLKPNNIIVGRYGEVMILDWGLAKVIKGEGQHEEDEAEDAAAAHDQTLFGKVVGTVTYMAPERAQGEPATFKTEVYALGVILYQILTLHHPFHRQSLQEFRKNMASEVLYPPTEVAPYRDVPPILSRVVYKCLAAIEDRYDSVDQLIHDLETYMEGRSEWFEMADLQINRKNDWEFQENVLIAEHMAITRGAEVADWVSLMISRASYAGNLKLEANVKIGEKGHGLGFLLSVPEIAERQQLNTGYCLWVASDLTKNTKLLRSTVEVIYAPEIYLQRNIWYKIRIEKIENSIYFYLNDLLQFSYISHLPLSGTHIGLLSRDADFEMESLAVYIGSESITVNCLAIPDAFLAHKDYSSALIEYRRIGYSFPGTAEGREAMFRAGIALLEEASNLSDSEEAMKKRDEALEEFSKLHMTPGGPLEYLGKALVYQSLVDYTEESKCFELAFRRYPHHPLLSVLQEQLIQRTHESSRSDRTATYQFLLLLIRYFPEAARTNHTLKLMNSLKNNWEPLYFIEEVDPSSLPVIHNLNFSNVLSFWLGRLDYLIDIINACMQMPTPNYTLICNALFTLIELGEWQTAEELLPDLPLPELALIKLVIRAQNEPLKAVYKEFSSIKTSNSDHIARRELRVLIYLMNKAISFNQPELVVEISKALKETQLSPVDRIEIDGLEIWAYLLQDKWQEAGEILHQHPFDLLAHESSIFHFLYGCWLCVTESKEIALIHFSSILEVPYPRSWALFSHFIDASEEELQQWFQKAFLWEKRQFYRQGSLFYYCAGNEALAKTFDQLAAEQIVE